MIKQQKTIFCDIDGTIVKHKGSLIEMFFENYTKEDLLPGVKEKFYEWKEKGYKIVITTARPNGMVDTTQKLLRFFELPYDMLIMDLPHGPRVVINDEKPTCAEMASGISVKRDGGLQHLDV